MGNVVTEEKAVNYVHYFHLLYSYSVTLYDMIPNAPCLSNDPKKTSLEPSFISDTKTTSSHAQTSEVNAVQQKSSKQAGGKKKYKGKSKKYSNEQDNPKTANTQLNSKECIPCIICEEDHYTK
jgi:hypothetical protein